MEAIKKLADIKDHKLTLDLPESFKHAKVEVIILPCEAPEEGSQGNAASWQRDFLSISCWDEKEGADTVQSWPLKTF